MGGLIPFAEYNLAVGFVVSLELLYFLWLEASATAYRRFMLLTVAGLVLAVIGGPITELFAPSLIHWVHGIAALLVILGFYDPVLNDVRTAEWARVLLTDPGRIRQQDDWMTPMDDKILEVLHGANLTLTPSIIAFNTGFSQKEVNRRLIELADHGFVEKIERGKYRQTRRGEQYLCGQFDTVSLTDDEIGVQS
ncbi:ArsR family transcriptional regulator [Saliphagus infecundisoli]|uniref:ArsR family transcriptional regulator n=1 Tax=Saliphagus infecundisoli TaxID=1849069 RepID=A0ABD5QHP2_9EURY|nr:ArsR family transcriptional regulator [Saliphagus infecundisoli]